MSDVDVTTTEYTVEVVDNTTDTTVVISGSNLYEVFITDASELSTAHINSTSNPHEVTATQVGLGNVINAEQLLLSQFETVLTPTASGSIPSSKAVADYISIAVPAPTANSIITLINNSEEIINDDNIASTIARDSEVSGSIASAVANLVNINDARLSDARTPLSHTHSTSDVTGLSTAIGSHTDVAANTSARHTHANTAVLAAISGSGSGEIITTAERNKLAAIEAGATGDMSGSEIVSAINSSSSLVDDDNIASTISRTNHTHSGTYEPAFSKNTAFNKNFGTDAGTVAQGNDSRLSDARTPLSHSHTYSDISSLVTTITDDDTKIPSAGAVVDYVSGLGAGDMLKATYDTDSDGKVNAAVAADSVPWSGVSSKPSTYPPDAHNHSGVYEPVIATKNSAFNVNFGSTTGTACQGNDARLSDSRTPLTHSHVYSDISSLQTTLTDDDTKIPSSGAVVDYVANHVVGLIIALGW